MKTSDPGPKAIQEPVPTDSTRVFLSYSRKDREFVDRLEKSLSLRGIKVYIDRTEIEKGADWWDRICQLIRMSDTVVFVLSPDSIQSDVCLQEVEYSVESGKRLMPIVCHQVDNQQVPHALRNINYIFFVENENESTVSSFDEGLEQLHTALTTDLPWVREHTRLSELAHYWDASGRSTDLLLQGKPLKSAISWLHETLSRLDEPAINPQNPLHLFIQSSAHKHYHHGPFNWRSPIMALPLILFLTLLISVAVIALEWSATLPLADLLGIHDNEVERVAQLALLLFVLYQIAASRSRYLIARNVKFLDVWGSRMSALVAVFYSLVCLAGFGALAFVFLKTR